VDLRQVSKPGDVIPWAVQHVTPDQVENVPRPPHPGLLPKGRRNAATPSSFKDYTQRVQQRPLSQQARLGVLAAQDGHIRKRIWRGEVSGEGVLLTHHLRLVSFHAAVTAGS
jgi:hypothetical protein